MPSGFFKLYMPLGYSCGAYSSEQLEDFGVYFFSLKRYSERTAANRRTYKDAKLSKVQISTNAHACGYQALIYPTLEPEMGSLGVSAKGS